MSQPKWQIDPQDFVDRLKLDLVGLEKHLQPARVYAIEQIVPLRAIAEVLTMHPLRLETLTYFMRHIPTRDGQFPYAKLKKAMVTRVDPHRLLIGQRFIYRDKYQTILEGLQNLFDRFAYGSGGFADLGAYYVFGLDHHGDYVLACYIPPIIEIHGQEKIIMDGVHRSYIARQTGVHPTVVLLDNVEVPFPCQVEPWHKAQVIALADRPSKMADRYFSLEPNYFRDLSHLGIDG